MKLRSDVIFDDNMNAPGEVQQVRCIRWCGFYFFTSRRRHTRLQGDWSSDVCSSHLLHASPRKSLSLDVATLVRGRNVSESMSALLDGIRSIVGPTGLIIGPQEFAPYATDWRKRDRKSAG